MDMLHSVLICFAVLHYVMSTCSISEASPINTVSRPNLQAFPTSLLYVIVHKYVHLVCFPEFLILNRLMDTHFFWHKLSGLSFKPCMKHNLCMYFVVHMGHIICTRNRHLANLLLQIQKEVFLQNQRATRGQTYIKLQMYTHTFIDLD